MRGNYGGISDSNIYRLQYKPIDIGKVTVGLTQRVNDFETVYLARNVENSSTTDNFSGRKKVAKSLEVFERSTRLYIVIPFLCLLLCLTLVPSRIFFGVVPFSLVVALVSTSVL